MNALLTALLVVLASPAIHRTAGAQAPLEQQFLPRQNTDLGSADAQSVYSRNGGDVAATVQAGRGNHAEMVQGAGNVAVVGQSGHGNSSSITQSADRHRAQNDQGGDAGFAINQSGQPGEIVVRQNIR